MYPLLIAEAERIRGLLRFPDQHCHPNEHVLQMTKEDLRAFPAAISSFNGFYSKSGKFVLLNSIHIFIALAIFAGFVLIALALILVRYIWRRSRAREQRAKADWS